MTSVDEAAATVRDFFDLLDGDDDPEMMALLTASRAALDVLVAAANDRDRLMRGDKTYRSTLLQAADGQKRRADRLAEALDQIEATPEDPLTVQRIARAALADDGAER